MSFAEFASSVSRDPKPPAALTAALSALWHDARGDWTTAHTCAQEEHDSNGAWVHAYLHRKEGDVENAAYWYARSGHRQPAEDVTLAVEWERIARELLGDPARG